MSNNTVKSTDLSQYMPEYLKNILNTSLTENLQNKHLTKDESIPLLGFVGDKISSNIDYIKGATADREINSLLPVSYTKLGVEEYVNTYDDVIRKLEVLGTDISDMSRWGAVKSFNLDFPIDLDKFANYSKYRWYGHLVPHVTTLPQEAISDGLNASTGEFVKAVPSNRWTIRHNLGYHPMVTVWVNGQMMLPKNIIYVDDFVLYIEFTSSYSGVARIFDENGLLTRPIKRPSYNPDMNPEYTLFNREITVGNDWSEFNFWVHEDDVADLGFTLSDTIQATRPIIEFVDGLLLNSAFKNGAPALASDPDAFVYEQRKTFRDQPPLFNLYRSDGSFTNTVSTLVKLTTSTTSSYDTITNQRLVTGKTGDYFIEHGFVDDQNRLLFCKINGELTGLWTYSGDYIPEYVNSSTTPGGAWKTPEPIIRNIEHESRKVIGFGDLLGHFTDIISNQSGFIGNEYGNNNYRNLVTDHSVGGKIKDYNGEYGRFFGLMNQHRMSVPGLLEFAREQYSTLLSTANDYVIQNLATILTDNNLEPSNALGIINNDTKVIYSKLLESFATRNSSNAYHDTTSGIPYFPITLPYLGLSKLYQPQIIFDNTVSKFVIIHHDGHHSIITDKNHEILTGFANKDFIRSDGNNNAGLIGPNPPARPYKNMFWFDTSVDELKMYSISSDDPASITDPQLLDKLYNRVDDVLYEWSSNGWEIIVDKMIPWIIIRPEVITNDLVLLLENQLYNSTTDNELLNPVDYRNNYPQFDVNLEYEFISFANRKNIDPYYTFYDPTDAFTWNYSDVVIGDNSVNHAVWHQVYFEFFGTDRPDLTPWFLQGYSVEPSWWRTLYTDNTTSASIWLRSMWDDIINDTTPGHPAPSGKWIKPIAVDVNNGNLLPPYVSSSDIRSTDALLTVMPPNTSKKFVFGDLGPNELTWRNSIEFQYAVASTIFVIDPITFVDTFWGTNKSTINQYVIDANTGKKNSHRDIILHGESIVSDGVPIIDTSNFTNNNNFTLTAFAVENGDMLFKLEESGIQLDIVKAGRVYNNSDFSLLINASPFNFELGDVIKFNSTSTVFLPSKIKKSNGLNQLFVNYNRYNSVDLLMSLENNLLRDWDINLGYRVGGLLNTELLTVRSDNFTINNNDMNIVLNRNDLIDDFWLHALRIQLTRKGTIKTDGNYQIPAFDGTDWEYRIETTDGIEPFITYYTSVNTSEDATFNILDSGVVKSAWKTPSLGTMITEQLPIKITGIQNVINFIFSYSKYLEDSGWHFDNFDGTRVDKTYGRVKDWQFEIEKFIQNQYLGPNAGQGFILSPFSDKIKLSNGYGMTSNFRTSAFVDNNVTPLIHDVLGNRIKIDDGIRVYRTDEFTEIHSDVPMFGIHIFKDSYEHVIVFDHYLSNDPSQDLIYDPFLGLRINRLHLTSEKQKDFNGRITFGGHYIHGKSVLQNIEGSIQSLTNMYDVENMTDGNKLTKVAKGLVGYTPKQYMIDTNRSPKSRFGFWRGLIHNKGSNLSVNAFLNSARFENAELDEYWAFKISEYGDFRSKTYPEIKLRVKDNIHRYLKLDFIQPGEVSSPGFLGVSKESDDLWFSIEDNKSNLYFDAELISTVEVDVTDPNVFYNLLDNNGLVNADYVTVFTDVNGIMNELSSNEFELINSSTIKFITPLITKFIVKCYGPSRPKFNPAKLIDYKSKVVIDDISLWDPARGSHVSEAIEIIDLIDKNDPAKYNYSVRTTNNSNYTPLRSWSNKEVGTVWWKTNNLSYIPYYDVRRFPTIEQRLSLWGSITDDSTIDIFEWTESTVHPSKWADLVKLQEGDGDLSPDNKASGAASLNELYFRDRTWKQRAIGWKYTDLPGINQHSFAIDLDEQLILTSGNIGPQQAILSNSNWNSIHTIDNMVFGSYDTASDTVSGEAIITGLEHLIIGSANDISTYNIQLDNIDVGNGPLTYFNNPTIEVLNDQIIPSAGPILFSSEYINSVWFVRATNLFDNNSQAVQVDDAPFIAGASVKIKFDQLALMISAVSVFGWNDTEFSDPLIRKEAIAKSFGNSLHDVYVRSAIEVNVRVPFIIDNNLISSFGINEIGLSKWVGWNSPTDLSTDLTAPDNRWQPIYGDWISVNNSPASYILIDDHLKKPFVTNTGDTIQKYQYDWSDYHLLSDDKLEFKFDGIFPTIPVNAPKTRVGLYVNGIFQKTSTFDIINNLLVINITPSIGDEIVVIIRKLTPSQDELSFDPTVKENSSTLIQYKYDYQYTTKEIRNEDGSINKILYYFWVSGKNLVTRNRVLSLRTATQMIQNNPNPYGIFQNIKPASAPISAIGTYGSTPFAATPYDVTETLNEPVKAKPIRYTQFITVGLNHIVTRDNTYKLRFTRDFILRENPDNLNLKNVHTEWILLRENQHQKIPESLWDFLVDSAAGEDLLGNVLPSINRTEYDKRHGTSTRFGLGNGQVMMPSALTIGTILYSILNNPVSPDLLFLDYTKTDEWFSSPLQTRKTLSLLWTQGGIKLINFIFFSVFSDALSENSEFSDVFKTSMISANSIRLLNTVTG